MLALYRSGRQADALEAYQAGRRVLQDELGLEPSKELRDLEAAILRQDEAAHAPAPEQAPHAEHAPAPRLSPESPSGSRPRGRRPRWRRQPPRSSSRATTPRRSRFRRTPSPSSTPKTNRVVEAVPVGARPGPVAAGFGSVWVGNIDDKTLSRIDLKTRRVVRTIPLGATPSAIAVGAGRRLGRARAARTDHPRRSRSSTRRDRRRSRSNAIYFSSAGVTTDARLGLGGLRRLDAGTPRPGHAPDDRVGARRPGPGGTRLPTTARSGSRTPETRPFSGSTPRRSNRARSRRRGVGPNAVRYRRRRRRGLGRERRMTTPSRGSTRRRSRTSRSGSGTGRPQWPSAPVPSGSRTRPPGRSRG